jgi:hypothetical protein
LHHRFYHNERPFLLLRPAQPVDFFVTSRLVSPICQGIPEPAFIDDPRGEWRSRLADCRWEVNSGHRDFAAASASAKRKLRYLAALLAKEVVLHSFPVPQGGPILERLVSLLGMTEPRLERG